MIESDVYGSAMDFSGELESRGIPDMGLHIEQAMRIRGVEKKGMTPETVHE